MHGQSQSGSCMNEKEREGWERMSGGRPSGWIIAGLQGQESSVWVGGANRVGGAKRVGRSIIAAGAVMATQTHRCLPAPNTSLRLLK